MTTGFMGTSDIVGENWLTHNMGNFLEVLLKRMMGEDEER